MIDQLATLAYGLLTLILTFIAALQVHSFWAMALTIAASGVTYVFQVVEQLRREGADAMKAFLWFLVIALVMVAWGFIVCA